MQNSGNKGKEKFLLIIPQTSYESIPYHHTYLHLALLLLWLRNLSSHQKEPKAKYNDMKPETHPQNYLNLERQTIDGREKIHHLMLICRLRARGDR
jgi:hypothetical protein